METKYYVDINGIYLGGWTTVEAAPSGAIEVPTAPENAKSIWNGTAWSVVVMPQPQDLTRSMAVGYINGQVPWELLAFTDIVRFGLYNATLRSAVWAKLKQDNPAWLTTSVKAYFVQYAIDAGGPVE